MIIISLSLGEDNTNVHTKTKSRATRDDNKKPWYVYG